MSDQPLDPQRDKMRLDLDGHSRFGNTIYGAARLPPVTLTMARYGFFLPLPV